MIYRIQGEIDEKLQRIFDAALNELNEFYGINWIHNLPRLIVLDNRKMIDALFGRKTEGWVIGWSEGRNIFVLDKGKFSEESDHTRYTDEEYAMLIKHEMSHSFCLILAKGEIKPKWLWEGIAIYTSGQNTVRAKPIRFERFLEYFDEGGKDVYGEAGFAVELLVLKYGKQKMLDLIKACSGVETKNGFSSMFKDMFGFEPSYKEFDRLL